MAKIGLGLLLFIAFPAWAWDSVAVFHRPEKVLVQINERGATGRLQSLFERLGADDDLLFSNRDQSFRMDCARNAEAATCIFRFLPSGAVHVEDRAVEMSASLFELSALADGDPLDIEFLNSNGDHFELHLSKVDLRIRASKRARRP